MLERKNGDTTAEKSRSPSNKQRVYGEDKLRRLQETGKLQFEFTRHGTMYELTEYYAELLAEYSQRG